MFARPTEANIRRYRKCRQAMRRDTQAEKRVELSKALDRTKRDLCAQPGDVWLRHQLEQAAEQLQVLWNKTL